MPGIRLQKYLADCGIASRRKAELLITQGRVKLNNQTVDKLGVKVNENDLVEVDGKPVSPKRELVYIMLNKPEGYVTTVRDQFGRKSVNDLVKGVDARLYPAGRLDHDTSGLLILTNDGDFAYRLTHPRHEVKKTYHAQVSGIPCENEIDNFQKGLDIEGYRTAPAKFRILKRKGRTAFVEIIIHEGKNRQVRKMCEKIGHPVITLKRVAIGNLRIGKLPCGKWRFLNKEDISKIFEK
ncbi:MAG TPA: rRNA pseudouridine synthase [Clostridiaceae bacterium]|nr:rRNA pseudouridine synthase [Clostridiaceae bacterium]